MATIGLLNATPNAAIVPPALVPLGTAAFALPLVFNFLITGLITGRIWWQSRQRKASIRNAGSAVRQPNSSYARKAMVVVVEAGVLYLLVQFVLTVLFAINHPAQIILADIAMQVYVSCSIKARPNTCSLTLTGYRTYAHFRSCQLAALPRRLRGF